MWAPLSGVIVRMTAVAAAVDALFADPNIAIDGIYTPAGGAPRTVRVIARRPDQIIGLGETRIHTATAVFDVRVSEVPAPAAGDALVIPASGPGTGETVVVQGEPRRDRERLVWTLDARPA